MALGKTASKTRAAIGPGVVALIINVIVIAALGSAGPVR
jgi:hypothetical protein